MKRGRRTLELSNPAGPHWVELGRLSTGLDVPALAAVGRRADDMILLWIYHRTGVFSLEDTRPATARLQLAEVPAGDWQVTWWDVGRGEPERRARISHPGGLLSLPTPPVSRYTAVWLERR